MSDKLIRQHNFLTTARYEMSALQKNIMYMLLVQLRDDDPWGKQYEVPIQALREKRGVEIPRVRLLSAAKKLIERGITIYHQDRKDFITIGILASADYGKDEKRNHLVLEFDQKLYPFLVNLKQRFTTYRLRAALDLRSKYSKRMYEMLSQFKDTGVMKVSLKELKTRLGLIDLETGKERYTEFGLFTSKVLDIAKRELAQHTELRFNYTARKTGKKYTDLEFKISYTPLFKGSRQTTIPVQSTTGENTSSNAKKSKYPHPDLHGDALAQYLQLTTELRWLDKKLAYRVVTSIPPRHLWNYIDKLRFEIRAGKATTKPADFFKALLERRNKKLLPIEVNKAHDKQATIPDADTAMRGSCYKKLVLDFGLDLFLVNRIATQIAPKIAPDKLKNFLDKILEEMQHKGISEGAKGNYLLERLKQEYQMSL